MKFLLLALTGLVSGAAMTRRGLLNGATLTRRADSCGQWDTIEKGDFTVYNNLWGQDNAESGKQCTGLDGQNGTTLAWHTTWSWTGGEGQVKSFANAAYQFEPKQLSEVTKIPTSWKWSYKGSDLVCNVAYDLFLSSSADGDAEYEIMIWLGALGGAGPISSTGSPIATPTIAGHQWQLFSGPNGEMQVFSFVAPSSTENFSTDLKQFLTYLQENQDLAATQYLTDVQAGTEPFSGQDAQLTVSSYSVTVA